MNIDLRSDTVTHPTPEMRHAMAEAEVGDDVFGEDPTVNQLETVAAAWMGKEAAVLVPSGTMANLVSVMTHCERGDEMITGSQAHLLHNEVGGAAAVANVQVRTVSNDHRGMLDPNEIEAIIRTPNNIHHPKTSLLCLENTHNRCSGGVLDVTDILILADLAHSHDIAVHIDGARIFNASVYLGIPPIELTSNVDTVSFCLSKGLSCPVGSLVCGSEETITKVRKNRKILGGGMRQAGIIAAAGLVALETMIDRLKEDHENARDLATGLKDVPGLHIDLGNVWTNIIMIEVLNKPVHEFIRTLRNKGVLVSYPGGKWVRMVTHYGVSAKDIDEALAIIESVQREKK